MYVLTHKWILVIKQRITSVRSTTSEKIGNNNPQRVIHGFPQEGKIDEISFSILVAWGEEWEDGRGVEKGERDQSVVHLLMHSFNLLVHLLMPSR